MFLTTFKSVILKVENRRKGEKSMNYNWENKQSRAKEAQEHTEYIDLAFGTVTRNAVSGTEIVIPESIFGRHIQFELEETDTVSSIFTHAKENCVALNFASYKNPGGKFLEGSRAQEECLCHESNLYNVLRAFDGTYYEGNRRDLNGSLYRDRLLYSPEILFERHDEKERNKVNRVFANVITCAAPNRAAAMKYGKKTEEENEDALRSRIQLILRTADKMGNNTLIAGAYGCGVFGQDAYTVARIFLEEASTPCFYNLRKIVFAIHTMNEESKKNYEAFELVFGKRK
jgi:uncharacterized protein (TIGR02452 family)